jgi:hypothetical protein
VNWRRSFQWRRLWMLAACLSLAASTATQVVAQSPAPNAVPPAPAIPSAPATLAAPLATQPGATYAQEKVVPPIPEPGEKGPPIVEKKGELIVPPVTGAVLPMMPAPPPGPGCCGGGMGGCCFPGYKPCCGNCSDCDSHTCIGRFFCGLYHCLCCPDPCYEPCWIPEQNAAFFVDPVRPWTQTRLRADFGQNYTFPDAGEFFMATASGKGRGPNPPGPTRINYDTFSLYQEIAPNKRFSFFFEFTGLHWQQDGLASGGFGDMNLGTKSVLCDCELILLAFQFRTYLPTGNPARLLGTGHVSLEPSLLASIKLAAATYLQFQAAEWFPIAGDPDLSGPVFHVHASLNHVLYRFAPDVPLIGTLEVNDYTYQGGAYTAGFVPGGLGLGGAAGSVVGITQSAIGHSFVSAGPGLRLSVCNRLDFGVGTAFGFDTFGPRQLYRAEVRWRY